MEEAELKKKEALELTEQAESKIEQAIREAQDQAKQAVSEADEKVK